MLNAYHVFDVTFDVTQKELDKKYQKLAEIYDPQKEPKYADQRKVLDWAYQTICEDLNSKVNKTSLPPVAVKTKPPQDDSCPAENANVQPQKTDPAPLETEASPPKAEPKTPVKTQEPFDWKKYYPLREEDLNCKPTVGERISMILVVPAVVIEFIIITIFYYVFDWPLDHLDYWAWTIPVWQIINLIVMGFHWSAFKWPLLVTVGYIAGYLIFLVLYSFCPDVLEIDSPLIRRFAHCFPKAAKFMVVVARER